MPPQFAMPTDNKAVGTGNPPADMNAVIDALAASGVTYNVLNAAYAGGADPTGAADSTAAFAACMAAAIAAPSGEMIIPPGSYTLNTGGLHITGPFRMRGLGAGLSNQNGTTFTPAVTLNSNTSGNLFDFPFQGFLWGGLEIENVSVNFTGSGNVFSGCNITDSVFRNMNITLTGTSSMAIVTSGSVSYLNVLHERCNFTTTNATRTNPMVSIATNTAAAVSNCTWLKCKFSNNGLNTTQPMVFYTCTAASGIAYHYMDNFIECWFEHPFGGALKCLAGQNITISGCTVWDIFSGATVGASTFYFGQQPSGANCQGVYITGCGRSQAGPDGAATWDIEVESTSSQVLIQGWTNKPASPTTNTNFFVNLHGCNDVVLIGNQSPQGASVNGNSTTVVTNPGATQFWVHNGAPQPFNVLGAATTAMVGAGTSGDASPRAVLRSDGSLQLGPGSAGTDTGLSRVSAGVAGFSGGLDMLGRCRVGNVGGGYRTAEGANAKQGTATLVAGAAVVSNTSVTASSRIFLTSNADGGTPGWLRVSARTAGTSFTITSSSGTDTSTVAYEIFEPA